MSAPNPPDLSGFRRAVQLRDRCRGAAVADGERLGIPLSGVQANVAFDAMVALIRADERARWMDEVDAALRDDDRFAWWAHQRNDDAALYIDTDKVADYLRDTLTPEED